LQLANEEVVMSEHIVSTRIYYTVFLLLLVLTAITVGVAYVDLGMLNNFVMLGIATTKATLVILYFMHVRYSPRLTWIVVASGFFWLGAMITFTVADPLSRGWLLAVGP
jgi:cytochrome c oxidase subunit 4